MEEKKGREGRREMGARNFHASLVYLHQVDRVVCERAGYGNQLLPGHYSVLYRLAGANPADPSTQYCEAHSQPVRRFGQIALVRSICECWAQPGTAGKVDGSSQKHLHPVHRAKLVCPSKGLRSEERGNWIRPNFHSTVSTYLLLVVDSPLVVSR